jgi:multidrug efflux system outer membrane protein
VPSGLPSDLLLRRPDIRQAEQSMIAANASIGAARALFFPNISLTASAGFRKLRHLRSVQVGSAAFTIAPSLYLPIFNAGRNRANLEVAEASQKIAVAQYEGSIQSAFREVSDTLVNAKHQGSARCPIASAGGRAGSLQAVGPALHQRCGQLPGSAGCAAFTVCTGAVRGAGAPGAAANQVNLYKVLGGGWTQAGRQRQQLQPSNRAIFALTQGVFGRLFHAAKLAAQS